jgi:hypothetical protein
MGNLNSKKLINDSLIKEIATSVDGLAYGEVIIKVHNNKIIQVDIAQKTRYDDIWKIEGGGGI